MDSTDFDPQICQSVADPYGLLHRHKGRAVTPIRVAQAAESANLECIGRPWRQAVNGYRASVAEWRYFRPWNGLSIGADCRVTQRVTQRFWNPGDLHQHLPAV